MEFVDRTEETVRLREVLEGEKSSFAVVYGRRRLGKSTLIKRVLAENWTDSEILRKIFEGEDDVKIGTY